MDANIEMEFTTKREAEGFIKGVKYVNNDRVEVIGMELNAEDVWVVFLWDRR
jgi:hypothetical protein